MSTMINVFAELQMSEIDVVREKVIEYFQYEQKKDPEFKRLTKPNKANELTVILKAVLDMNL